MASRLDKRWLYLGIGAAVAVTIGVVLALFMSRGQDDGKRMNDQPTGLVVNISDAPPVDSKKPLRCYVNGEFVGTLTLGECAEKNGVAAQSLDVGLDDSGNMAAAPTASLAPPPVQPTAGEPAQPSEGQVNEPVGPTTVASGPTAPCLRYSSNQWTPLSDSMTLGQCVHTLYEGRCVSPGSASYGRWGGQTLRLVPKRVEVSDDNKNFRTLAEQGQGCSVPQIR